METKNLLPFDLEVALKEPEKVVFENGEKPLEWHYFKHQKNLYCIIAIDLNGISRSVKKDGSYDLTSTDSPYNLHLLPKTVTLWGNVILNHNNKPEIIGCTHKNKKDAISKRNPTIQYIGEPFSVEVKI